MEGAQGPEQDEATDSLGASLGVPFVRSSMDLHTELAEELNITFTPENTGIAFDLHDVLVRFKYKQAFKHIAKMEGKKKVAKLLLKPKYAKKMFSSKVHIEQRLKEMIDEEEDPKKKQIMQNELQTIAYQVYNSHDFDPHTLALITELKATGYRLFLLSNIGSECFEQFQKAIPEIFEKFTGFYTANPEDQYLKKPSPVVFNSFLSRFAHLNIPHFVFVDDKQENVDGAKLAGLHGVVYENALQLRDQFVLMGLLAKRSPYFSGSYETSSSSSSSSSASSSASSSPASSSSSLRL